MEATVAKIQETVNSLSKVDKKWYQTTITKDFWGDSEISKTAGELTYCYISFKKEPKNEIKKKEFWDRINLLIEKGLVLTTWEDDQINEIAIAVEATDEFIEYHQSLRMISPRGANVNVDSRNNPENTNLPKDKELDFYKKLIEGSTESDGNFICHYKCVGLYNPNQIGAYLTTLKEKGIIISIDKKNKAVTVKNIVVD